MARDTSNPNSKLEKAKFVNIGPGPFVGKVVNNEDPERMGRLAVEITTNTGTDSGYSSKPGGYVTQVHDCQYLSPFYGVKSPVDLYGNDTNANDYRSTRHSYGMWMTPPDIGTRVLVIFAEGISTQAFWIGCIPEPNLNHMVPGIASSTNTGVRATGDFDQTKLQMYGTENVPAGEINDRVQALSSTTIRQPIHPFAETLRQQGLIQDTVRGTTSSSARRESPSQVFGISTPGRIDPTAKPVKVGTKDTVKNRKLDRLTGHTFVMDDGETNGDNQLVRLRSASGHQILLNDSAGVVYIANGSGNAWMEFSSNGAIDIYSSGAVSMRAAGDMNFHSDGNINMFAKNQIKMSSVSKMVLDALAIQQHADFDIQLQATGGSITAKSPTGSIISYAGQQQIHMASGQTHLTGSQVHFNSIGTNPNIVKTYERTSVLDFSGTGTKRELIPDVITAEKYRSGPLTITEDANVSMSGMRVPTHEPYPYHYDQVVSFVGGAPSANDKIPGTAEFIAARNRVSDNDTIRFGQFQADLQYELEKQGLGKVQTAVNKGLGSVKSTQGTIDAIQKAADAFTKDYGSIYGLPQDTLKTITPITSGVNEIVNQTVSSIVGENKTGTLLKDAVLVNQSGQLFTAGNFSSPLGKNVGTVKGVLDTVSKNTPILSQAGVYSTIGRIGIGLAETGYKVIKDPKGAAKDAALSLVSKSWKQTIGGQVTANTSITQVLNTLGSNIKQNIASVTTAIGKIFKW